MHLTTATNIWPNFRFNGLILSIEMFEANFIFSFDTKLYSKTALIIIGDTLDEVILMVGDINLRTLMKWPLISKPPIVVINKCIKFVFFFFLNTIIRFPLTRKVAIIFFLLELNFSILLRSLIFYIRVCNWRLYLVVPRAIDSLKDRCYIFMLKRRNVGGFIIN